MNSTFLVYRIKECSNVILHGLVRQCFLADTIGLQHSLKTLTLFQDEAKEIDTLFKVHINHTFFFMLYRVAIKSVGEFLNCVTIQLKTI